MTLDEIQSLREENPMEFNAMVAEKVHGFQIIDGHGLLIGQKVIKNWKGPDDPYEIESERKLWKVLDNYQATQHYHSDANADLLSHRVACGWDFKKRLDYLQKLARILNPSHAGLLGLEFMYNYKEGSFSAAALATVMEDSAKGEE